MWHLLLAIDCLDLVQGLYVRTEATMDTEDLFVDDGRQRKEIHDLSAVAPHIDTAVLAHALIVEAVDLGDLS